tara:strand:- start:1316 stop:1543 length:228 start_codon:yes stop_codon:yes gene_type:complete
MSVEVKIHEIDTNHKECVLTIIDNGVVILEKKNIGLKLKSNGSADHEWIQDRVKEIVAESRLDATSSIDVHKDGN